MSFKLGQKLQINKRIFYREKGNSKVQRTIEKGEMVEVVHIDRYWITVRYQNGDEVIISESMYQEAFLKN